MASNAAVNFVEELLAERVARGRVTSWWGMAPPLAFGALVRPRRPALAQQRGMDLSQGTLDLVEPGCESGLLSLGGAADLGDEPGRDGRGDETDEGDADLHERDGNEATGAGDRVGVAVADGGDGGGGPPERVAEVGDVGARGVAFGSPQLAALPLSRKGVRIRTSRREPACAKAAVVGPSTSDRSLAGEPRAARTAPGRGGGNDTAARPPGRPTLRWSPSCPRPRSRSPPTRSPT